MVWLFGYLLCLDWYEGMENRNHKILLCIDTVIEIIRHMKIIREGSLNGLMWLVIHTHKVNEWNISFNIKLQTVEYRRVHMWCTCICVYGVAKV